MEHNVPTLWRMLAFGLCCLLPITAAIINAALLSMQSKNDRRRLAQMLEYGDD